ncbi:MAG: type II secretion system protein [Pseudomonadota bacterium]
MKNTGQKGFTLIEVIITIVMISIAGLMMMTFLDVGFTRSGDPMQILDDNYSALRAIEIVNADYRGKLENNPSQDIGFYVSNDLSSKISGLTGIAVSGNYINFGNPDANRQVNEVSAGGATIYVKIVAVKNQSRLVTILGN